MDKASEALLALKPVTFHYKTDKQNTPQFGLIVEEVAKVNPNLVVRDENGQVPAIPAMPDAPESWRRLLAIHRELSRLSANGIYFLSYRNAGEACGLTHQAAHTVTAALVTVGAIEIVAKGKAGSNSRKAAEFRYLLSHDGEVEI
jgi:hypothetical protein